MGFTGKLEVSFVEFSKGMGLLCMVLQATVFGVQCMRVKFSSNNDPAVPPPPPLNCSFKGKGKMCVWCYKKMILETGFEGTISPSEITKFC